MRAVAGQPATLRLQVASDGGTAIAADAPPTVSVISGDGTTVLYPATAATADSGTGAYKWVLPAQTQLDQLTATWSYQVAGAAYTARMPVNVVADRLADPYLCRQNPDVAAANLTDAQLLDLVDQVEDKIEEFIGYPPVLSGARQQWDTLRGTLTDALYISGTVNGLPYGWGAGRLLIPGVKMPVVAAPGAVYSGSVNGVALDPVADIPNLRVIEGALAWSDYRPWISGRYQMWLTHGDPTPPGDLRGAARRLVAFYAKTTSYPDRAAQVITEGATIVMSFPDKDHPTGIPDVDAVLRRCRLESVI